MVGACGQQVLTLCGRRADRQTILLNLLHEGVKLVLPALLSARAGTTTHLLLLLYYYYYY